MDWSRYPWIMPLRKVIIRKPVKRPSTGTKTTADIINHNMDKLLKKPPGPPINRKITAATVPMRATTTGTDRIPPTEKWDTITTA